MISFTEYLTEALLEASKDPRRNPPKFTADQIANNKKLFQHVAYVVKTAAIKSKHEWAKDFNGDFTDKIGFVPSYNIKDNANYRNEVEGEFSHYAPSDKSYESIDAELLTDTTKNTVSIIARTKALGARKLIDAVYKQIETSLKKIASDVNTTKLDSGRQYGYVWKLEEPDYSKCEKHPDVRSALSTRQDASEKSRLSDERKYQRGGDKLNKSDIAKRSAESAAAAAAFQSSKAYKLIESIAKKHGFGLAGFDNWEFGYYLEKKFIRLVCYIRVRDQESGDFYALDCKIEGPSQTGRVDYDLTEMIKPSDKIADLFDVPEKIGKYAFIRVNGERGDQFEFRRPGRYQAKRDEYGSVMPNYEARIPKNVRRFARELGDELDELPINSFPQNDKYESMYGY